MTNTIARKGAITPAQFDLLMSSDDTGIELSDRITTKKIKILSSDKQYKYFENPDDLSFKDYGKMFLFESRDELLDARLLVSKISGTLLRSAYGYQVYPALGDGKPDFNQKPIGSGQGMIRNDEKMWWMQQNPGLAYQNQVRVILCTSDYEEAIERMSNGDNPFVELRLKKSSYGAWFPVGAMMNKAIADDPRYPAKTARKIKAPVFTLEITSTKSATSSGEDYYVFEISKIGINSPDTASKFMTIYEQWKDVQLFNEWKSETEEQAENIGNIEVDNEEKIINPEQMPWE